MAMDAAAMRALFQRLRFSNAAATALTDEQGLNSLEELGLLTDDDSFNVCKILKRLGGTTTNDDRKNVLTWC